MSFNPFAQTAGFSSLTTQEKSKRWDDGIPWFDIPDNKWVQLRFFGPIYAVSQHWFKTKSNKRFALLCPAYDSTTRRLDHKDKCPVEALIDYKNTEIQEIKSLAPRQTVFMHAVVRELQQKGEVEYIRPFRLPITLALAISNLKGMNLHAHEGVNYEVDIADINYGADIMIFAHANPQNPSSKYQVQFFQKTALSAEEQAAAATRTYNWSELVKYPSYNDIMQALERNGYLDNSPAAAAADQAFAPAPPPPPMMQAGTFAPPPPPAFAAPAPAFAAPAAAPVAAPAFAAPPPPVAAPAFAPPPPPVAAAPAFAPPPVAAPAVAPTQPQTAVAQQAAPTLGGEQGKKFQVSGRPEPVSANEFQSLIGDYSTKLDRGGPLKAWDGKDELAGLNVLACFAKYQGDGHCLKCPTRRWCIQH